VQDQPEPAPDPRVRSNFTDYKHNLGYSYANPYPGATAVAAGYQFTNRMNPAFALAADLNPGVAGQNSRNHEKRGQNVLFADFHVAWQTTTKCGVNGDDIYTNKAGAFNASPVDATDSVLLPTDQ
jgi:prepilin-type processing-associated H-X9-DG protein